MNSSDFKHPDLFAWYWFGGPTDDDDDDEPPPDELGFECGWYPEAGICLLAGTEDCDFECEFRDSLEAEFNQERSPEIPSESDCPPSIRIDP